MLFGVDGVIKVVAVLIIVLITAGGLWHITSLKANLAVAEENTKKMTAAVEQQQAAITALKADQESIQRLNRELNAVVVNQKKDIKSLEDRFKVGADGKSRDLGKIATEKTVSVEKAVNRGTKNAMRCLEIASGSPLTESEKNANTRETINKECPSLANPNYNPNK